MDDTGILIVGFTTQYATLPKVIVGNPIVGFNHAGRHAPKGDGRLRPRDQAYCWLAAVDLRAAVGLVTN